MLDPEHPPASALANTTANSFTGACVFRPRIEPGSADLPLILTIPPFGKNDSKRGIFTIPEGAT
jgi:hypothetical protein